MSSFIPASNNIRSDSDAINSSGSKGLASIPWYRVGNFGALKDGDRLHACIEGRYVTIFRHKHKLSCIDSICHHAGGPLTVGKLQDIEDLGGMTVVLCPWHKFMVGIDSGLKAYQGIEVINGKPTVVGWKVGKQVQRPHLVKEVNSGLYVSLQLPTPTDSAHPVSFENGEEIPLTCSSDNDAYSARCAQDIPISCVVNDATPEGAI